MGMAERQQLPPSSIFQDSPLAPEMVVIPPGKFVMGLTAEEIAKLRKNESTAWWCDSAGPQREVTISAPFAVGRFAVTFDEWERAQQHPDWTRFTGINPRIPHDENWGRGRRPVINVSWRDAKCYCTWLSQVTDNFYRLLAEAEWEYCCRAGTTTPFWWGVEASRSRLRYFDIGWENQQTVPVDRFEPNPWGLYQVHGNVFEWCEDGWHKNYENNPPVDGTFWQGGDEKNRVNRGGSWGYAPFPSAGRSYSPIDHRSEDIGFRVAMTISAH